MAENKKRRFRFRFNVGAIVFLVVVIYLAVYVVNYLGKEKLAVYEVSASHISDTITASGMILRDETLVTTEEKGYINYYVKDGSKVKKDGTVYTVDTTGKLQKFLQKLLKKKDSMSSDEKQQIYEDLTTFGDSFSDDAFSQVYETKDTISHDMTSYTDTVIADNIKKIEKKFGSGSYVEVAADESCLVSYLSDGLEEVTESNLTREIFDSEPKMQDLRSSEEQEAGSPVYRKITGQNWELVIPVDEDTYNRLKSLRQKNVDTVQVTVQKDNFVTNASFDYKKKEDGYYAILSFDNYIQRYVSQRYLTVEILLSETEGLKIPSGSLVTKEVFRIPSEYLVKGSDSGSANQVNVLTKTDKGEEKLVQDTVNIYASDGEDVLVTSDTLQEGDVISDTEKTKSFTLNETDELQGVYVVNRGYTVFEPVNILERNEDYCIIDEADGNVVLYDRIVLNSGAIEENQVIY